MTTHGVEKGLQWPLVEFLFPGWVMLWNLHSDGVTGILVSFLGGIAKRPRFLRAWPFVASYEFWGLGFAYRASSSSRHTATSFISSRTPQMSSRAFFMKVPPLLLSMQQRFRYLLMQEEEWGHIQRRCR